MYYDTTFAPHINKVSDNMQKGVSTFFSPKLHFQFVPACSDLPKDYHALIVINYNGKQYKTPFGRNLDNLLIETRLAFGFLWTQLLLQRF